MAEKDFLRILRTTAIHVKLQADIRFGGAVDIESLTRALNSIRSSYESYFEAEARNLLDKKITKSVGKEISKLARDSQLLIVNLSFASFSASLAPNTVTIDDNYASIPEPIQMKKGIFESYQANVIYADYSNYDFIQAITNRFSVDERRKIYRPLYDNLASTKAFKFTFGADLGEIDKSFFGFDESALEAIAPTEVKQLAPNEKLYKIYVSTSGEVDLFGHKPVVKKYLASEELKYATYPYQVREVSWDGYKVVLKDSLSAEVSFDEEAGLFRITYDPLNIIVWGNSRIETEEAFQMAFVSLMENFYHEKDDKLTSRAIEIKQTLVRLILTFSDETKKAK